MPKGDRIYEIAIASLSPVAGDAPEAWLPTDRIEIISLMWEDGIVEGDRAPAEAQARLDANRAAQLRAFLALLREARAESIDALQAKVASAMAADAETRASRDTVLADLDELARTGKSRAGHPFGPWLAATIREHQEWLARIVLPKL